MHRVKRKYRYPLWLLDVFALVVNNLLPSPYLPCIALSLVFVFSIKSVGDSSGDIIAINNVVEIIGY